MLIDAGRLERGRQGASEHALEEAHPKTDGGVTEALGRALELGEEGQALAGAADVSESEGLLAGQGVVLSEELMHVARIGAAVAEVHLFLLGDIEHLKAADEAGREGLHPAEVMGAGAELVGQVRVIELLHHLELNVGLGDVGVHEEALAPEGDAVADAALAAELKLTS